MLCSICGEDLMKEEGDGRFLIKVGIFEQSVILMFDGMDYLLYLFLQRYRGFGFLVRFFFYTEYRIG